MGGLIKTMWIAPNAAFDETLGLRVRLADGLSLGFFGGVSQNISPVGTNLFQQALDKNTIKPGLYVEQDPHVSVALWGKVPGASVWRDDSKHRIGIVLGRPKDARDAEFKSAHLEDYVGEMK